MKLARLLYNTIRLKFKEFCQHCTLHGTYYFYESSQRWVHAIWTLIILSSFSLCCFLSHMIWNKFAVDPTLTVVETTRYPTADLPFPAVTVCDTNPVYLPHTDNVTYLLKFRGYNHTQITEFYQSFSDIKTPGYTPKSYVRKMHLLLDDLGYSFKKLLETFMRPCDMLLVECAWRSQVHNCSAMFRAVHTVVGYCCQFDIPFFSANTNEETNLISGAQATEGLDIIVSEKRSSDDVVDNTHLLLYIFDLKDKITLMTNPVVITPNAYFDINIYLWTIDSSSSVKALALDKRKCFLETDLGAASSTYEGCLSGLIMSKVIAQCQCIPFDFTAQELNVQWTDNCIWERLACIYDQLDKVQTDIRSVMSQMECYQKCDYVQYENKVEFVKNLREVSKVSSERCTVTVHFSDSTCIKYRREVLYTWDQMLANLGGIFGLCLGGSIISIIELLWFIIELIVTLINEMIQGRKKPIKPKNKVFSVAAELKHLKLKEDGTIRYKFAN